MRGASPAHARPSLDEIELARERITRSVVRTPLVRLHADVAGAQVFLKLENLQPIGSFKLRGAGNALARADAEELADGVWTASAGNMAQAVAWHARKRALSCTAVVPDIAPPTKLDAIARLGGDVVRVPFDAWLEVFRSRSFPGMTGVFVHPFSDPDVIAGNGTIALELVEDLPDVDAVLIPYGGGGLCCGIAAALRERAPRCRIYACEVATAAPLAASLEAGAPLAVPYAPSFVDGIGAPTVFPEMFGLARELVDGSIVVGVDEIARAVELLATRNHVVAEGAGAAPVAAALSGRAGTGNLACIVSGGNIEASVLATILAGNTP